MGNKAGGKKDPSVLTDDEISSLKFNTQYSEEEIRAWHAGFLKDCPSGKLDKKQFLSVYKVCNTLKWVLLIYLVSVVLEILSGGQS